jgi:hypothetical protein
MNGTKKYILNEEGEPRQCNDLLDWAGWFEVADRRVALDMVGEGDEQYCISTVFLGLDYGFGWQDKPIVWETMVFKGKESMWHDRCSGSREQALAMHAEMVKKIRAEHKRAMGLRKRAPARKGSAGNDCVSGFGKAVH